MSSGDDSRKSSPGRRRDRTPSLDDRSRSPSPGSEYSNTTYSNNAKRGSHERNGRQKGSRPAKHGGGGQTTGMSGVVDTVTQRVLSARRLKINELRNENEALKRQMAAVIEENKTLKRSMHAQGRALDRYEGQDAEMSGVLARYAEEVRVARESERKMKERAHKLEKKIKEQDEDVQRKNKLLAKLKSLVDDKSLPERDELNRQLAKATEELETASEKLKKLEQHLELLNKNHKHEIGIERARLRDVHTQITKQQEQINSLQNTLKEKEKELDARNIYSYHASKASSQYANTSQHETPLASQRQPRKSSLLTAPGQAALPRDKSSSKHADATYVSPQQKAQKYSELLQAHNEEEAGGEGVEPPTRVGGESEVDVDGEYRAYGRDGLSEGVSATKRRQQLAAAKAEPVIDYSKPWDFKSKKSVQEDNQAKSDSDQHTAEERLAREAREREERQLEEQRRQEWERSEREKREREAKEKWEQERHAKEQLEQERRVKEQLEQERRKQRERDEEAERQAAATAAASNINNAEKNDLLNKLMAIDSKKSVGRNTVTTDDFNRKDDIFGDNPNRGRHPARPTAVVNNNDDGGYMPSFGPGRYDSNSAGKGKSGGEEKPKKTNLMDDLFGKPSNASSNNNNNWASGTSKANNNADVRRPSNGVNGNANLNDTDNNNDSVGSSTQLLPRRVRQTTTTITKPTVNAIDRVEDDIEEVLL